MHEVQRAVQDKATVPICKDARHAKIGLNQRAVPGIDPEFEEMTEGEEQGQDDELAFYAALATDESAVEITGHEEQAAIARELIEAVRKNASIH